MLIILVTLFQYFKNLYQKDIKFQSVILGFSKLSSDLN